MRERERLVLNETLFFKDYGKTKHAHIFNLIFILFEYKTRFKLT